MEINNKLSGKRRMAAERGDLDFDEFIHKGEAGVKERNKEKQRTNALKLRYA